MGDFQSVKDLLSLSRVLDDLGYPADRSGKRVCPVCGSGTHEHATPAMHVRMPEDRTWHCFSCGAGGDVFDFAAVMGAGDDKREQLALVRDEWAPRYGWETPLEPSQPSSWTSTHEEAQNRVTTPPEPFQDHSEAEERERNRILSARTHLTDPAAVQYLASRGFTLEEAQAYGLGYDPSHRSIVIPFAGSDFYHIDRSIVTNEKGKYRKPRTSDVGKQPIYNEEAFSKPSIIIVEGPMDALALAAVGYGDETIALCGTAYRDVVQAAKVRRYQGTVFVALDADDAGDKAQTEMLAELREAGIDAQGWHLWSRLGVKDAGEALQRNRQALADAVAAELRRAEEEREQRALRRLNLASGEDVLASLYDRSHAGVEPVETGFRRLDRFLDGGLIPGLYILGAVSSLGKTTYLVQMADQIAASGRQVLFVTLEQGATELVAKSISRMMAESPQKMRVSSQALMMPSRCSAIERDPVEGPYLNECRGRYLDTVAPHMAYQEAVEGIYLADIEGAARYYYQRDGVAPVIFLDYLQLVRLPDDQYASERQAVDRVVTALRVLSKDLQTPVIAISSLNRASYSGVISMSAYKESGGIEYGADVLLGLQPTAVREAVADGAKDVEVARALAETKAAHLREMELVVLKNRSGRITGEEGVPFVYDPFVNLFMEGAMT